MKKFYIQTQDGLGRIFELNSTTNVKYKEAGKATEFPVEAGGSSTDNYTETPTTINFSGTITSVGEGMSPEEFSFGLIRLKKNKQLLTVHSVASIGATYNCIIENIDFEHTPKRGVIGSAVSAKVSITFKQIRIANQARVIAIPKKIFEGLLSEKEKAVAGTKKVDGSTDPDKPGLFDNIAAAFKEFFSNDEDSISKEVQ